MKKIFTVIAAATICMVLHAEVNPALNYYNYSFNNDENGELSHGWTCLTTAAAEAEPTETAANYGFKAGGPAFLVFDPTIKETVAWSNTSFSNPQTVSNYLISPEVEITEDNAMLQFKIYTISDKTIDHLYRVYVAENVTSTGDFASLQPICDGKVGGKGSPTELGYVAKVVTSKLEGYKGKKVHLVFEDCSNDALLTGFSNITVSEYALDVVNNSTGWSFQPGKFSIDMAVTIMTPEDCEGFTAVLTDKDGKEISTYTTTKNIGQRYTTTKFTFDNQIELAKQGDSMEYTVTITPNLEGYTTSGFEYILSCGEGYPRICVMEEPTGTKCGYCPRGIAYMKYYNDTYGDRFVGIAVHSSLMGTDPMATDYEKDMNNFKYISGLPNSLINRTGGYIDPSSSATVASVMEQRSPVCININSVVYDNEANTLTVSYTPEFNFAMMGSFGACAILREDGVHGDTNRWNQDNYFSGDSSKFPADMASYFEEFYNAPDPIPAASMTYDHVGWGVYNDFNGSSANLPTKFEKGKAASYTLTFDIPSKVQDIKNTNVVMIFTDLKTGEILTATVMEAAEYSTSSVNMTDAEASKYSARLQRNTLLVNAEAGASVEVYSAAGTLLKKAQMMTATQSFTMPAANGLIVVRISKKNSSRIVKLMNM